MLLRPRSDASESMTAARPESDASPPYSAVSCRYPSSIRSSMTAMLPLHRIERFQPRLAVGAADEAAAT